MARQAVGDMSRTSHPSAITIDGISLSHHIAAKHGLKKSSYPSPSLKTPPAAKVSLISVLTTLCCPLDLFLSKKDGWKGWIRRGGVDVVG
jgi:hypothetical protein